MEVAGYRFDHGRTDIDQDRLVGKKHCFVSIT
jgi:hypothetical protein